MSAKLMNFKGKLVKSMTVSETRMFTVNVNFL